MKTTTKIIAITMAIGALVAAPAVFAHQGMGMGQGMQQGQGMGPGMMGHGPAMGPGMGMGRMAGVDPAQHATRMAEFKAALKITAEQEPAWSKFEATMRQQAEARQRETMQKLHAERDAARAELFAVLTPEQKALADRAPQGRHGRHGHHMAMQAPAK
jgi:hypothetical protein